MEGVARVGSVPPGLSHQEVARFGRVSLEVGVEHGRPVDETWTPLWARLRLPPGHTERMIDDAVDYAERRFPFLAITVLRVVYDRQADLLYLWEYVRP